MAKTVVFILAVFIISCTRGKIVPDSDYGFGKATLNGSEWTAKVRASYMNGKTDTIVLFLENMAGLIPESQISFYKISTQLTRQAVGKLDYSNLNKRLAARYTVARPEGIVLCTLYNVLEADSLVNNITITHYDSTTKEIEGTFEISFLIDISTFNSCDPGAKDTIRVRNGEFNTRLH